MGDFIFFARERRLKKSNILVFDKNQ